MDDPLEHNSAELLSNGDINANDDHSQKSMMKPYVENDAPSDNTFLGTSIKYYKWKIVWRNVIAFIYLHMFSLYALYLLPSAKWQTIVISQLLALIGGIGITAGAHRLWAHRTYKAKWPLRIILTIFQTLAFQNHIHEWVRDHRTHHKYSETDADPHNAKRGFFFAHIGWLMVRKQKEVIQKGKTIDMTDVESDPIAMFQKKYYLIVMPLITFLIPTIVPIYLWDEKPWISWYIATVLRYTLSLNFTWLVNSAAHLWGNKPFDKNIGPTDNWRCAIAALGEGWHNYHHVFPWDYKTSELGGYSTNISKGFIDFFAYIGWAYDLKTVPPQLVLKRAKRTGDGTHESCTHHSHDDNIWGWGDKDMDVEDVLSAVVLNKLNNNGKNDD